MGASEMVFAHTHDSQQQLLEKCISPLVFSDSLPDDGWLGGMRGGASAIYAMLSYMNLSIGVPYIPTALFGGFGLSSIL